MKHLKQNGRYRTARSPLSSVNRCIFQIYLSVSVKLDILQQVAQTGGCLLVRDDLRQLGDIILCGSRCLFKRLHAQAHLTVLDLGDLDLDNIAFLAYFLRSGNSLRAHLGDVHQSADAVSEIYKRAVRLDRLNLAFTYCADLKGIDAGLLLLWKESGQCVRCIRVCGGSDDPWVWPGAGSPRALLPERQNQKA